MFIGDEANVDLLRHQLGQVLGSDVENALGSLLVVHSQRVEETNLRLVSAASLLIAASATFVELRAAINRMNTHDSDASTPSINPSRYGWAWSLLKARFLSLSIVIGLGFLLVAWLTIDTLLAILYERFLFGAGEVIAYVLTTAVTLLVLFAAFYALLRVLPDHKFAPQAVWRGTAISVLLFVSGKWAMTVVLVKVFNVGTFGAASGLIALLVWIFYAAAVFLFGAQVAAVYERSELTNS
ncbi:MAG: YihY/virulence factor BrkB family protein [Betaproteobacteria bacterium]|nr:MAG: YihY/virulence factor BrkB family protein [Betaproteobacteria bacterium]